MAGLTGLECEASSRAFLKSVCVGVPKNAKQVLWVKWKPSFFESFVRFRRAYVRVLKSFLIQLAITNDTSRMSKATSSSSNG